MKKYNVIQVVDKVGIVLLLLLAILLRTNLAYRSAFIDEAMNIYMGSQMLQGIQTYFLDFHMGYAPLTSIPWALADQLGGVAAARGLNAVMGVLTVLFVMLTARKVYGEVAGFIAGGIMTVFGPALFISTFAVYDAWSVCFVSLAVYLWTIALADRKDIFLLLGSFAMTLAVFAKYAGVTVALVSVVYGIVLAVLAVSGVIKNRSAEAPVRFGTTAIIKKLALFGLPFLLLVAYALAFWPYLQLALARTVIRDRHATGVSDLQIFLSFAEFLWPLFPAGVLALIWRRRRIFSAGFFLVGISVMLYHFMNNDDVQINKHVNYLAVGWSLLAGGGLILTFRNLLSRKIGNVTPNLVSGILGLVIIAYLGWYGQYKLPDMHSYWYDTTELMTYLKENLNEGDTILMEAGEVGRYYLILHGEPGHVPAEVALTWYYKDEQGEGIEAYKRSITAKKFDFIIFDNLYTPGFNEELLKLMEGHYKLEKSFPGVREYRFPKPGQTDVYTPVQ